MELTGRMRITRQAGSPQRRRLMLASVLCFATSAALALPTGPQVVAGTAALTQTGSTLNISNSNGAILDWQSFNIGSNETARFLQPSASSSVLNRVLTRDPSVILGQLQSNGQVWLINPAGILVGEGARIDTGAFVASTLNVSNADFLARRMKFEATPGAGAVVNQGSMVTPLGGHVYLIGSQVENRGLVSTPHGETLLAAGQTVELVDTATPGVKVEISGAEGQVTNLSQIAAEAGRIGIFGAIVRNSGVLDAGSAVAEGGRIFLRASKKIDLAASSKVGAGGTAGGSVTAIVDAGGQLAGELIAGGEISAAGNGSKGSGGFVETSAAKVDVNAVSVRTGGGTWLIDPLDFTVAASGGDISGSALASNLNNGNVTIQSSSGAVLGTGDIYVNDAISWCGCGALTLSAQRNININRNITATSSPGSLTLNANTGGGGGISILNATVSLNNGSFNFSGGNLQLYDGATIVGAALAGSASIVVPGGMQAMLDGVTLGSNLYISARSGLFLKNGLTLNNSSLVIGDAVTQDWAQATWIDSMTIGGSGEIVFNNGPYSYSALGSYTTGSALTIGPGITVRLSTPNYATIGNNYYANGVLSSVINRGTIAIDYPGSLFIGPDLAFSNEGKLQVAAGTLAVSNVATNSGIIESANGATIETHNADFINAASGVIQGDGKFALGTGALTNNGTISPGSATTTGTLTIDGQLINNGTIQTKIAGNTPGNKYDVLAVTGKATLGGTLTATFFNGYQPLGDQSYNPITAASFSGSFANRNFPTSSNVSLSTTATAITINTMSTTAPPTINQCVTNPSLAGCQDVLPTVATCTLAPAFPGCSLVLPSLATCIGSPTTAGCSVVLPPLSVCTALPTTTGCTVVLPSLASCIADRNTSGCSAVLPSIASCTAAPTTPGCSVVLLPSLASCIATPTAAGCSQVLPSLTSCIATPSTTGCSVVLPSLATCTSAPTTAGCSVVLLPSLASCIAAPSTAGCSQVLPSLASCIAAPSTTGCSVVLPSPVTCANVPATPGCTVVVLPTLASCIAAPSTAGCTAVLPSLATCAAAPNTAGCSVVLPSPATCASAPTTAGCSVVLLPSLATCIATPSTAGCAAVLPSLSTCTSAPNSAGCSVVLPSLATCTSAPTTAGCSAVLPANCSTTPSAAACPAAPPSLATCASAPTTAGCASVLPAVTDCSAHPTATGCAAVVTDAANYCTLNPGADICAVVTPDVVVDSCAVNPGAAGCAAAVATAINTCSTNPTASGCQGTPAPQIQSQQQQSITASGVANTASSAADKPVTSNTVDNANTPSVVAPSVVTVLVATPQANLPTLTLANGTIGGVSGQFGGDAPTTSVASIASPQATATAKPAESSASGSTANTASKPADDKNTQSGESKEEPAKSPAAKAAQKRPAQCT